MTNSRRDRRTPSPFGDLRPPGAPAGLRRRTLTEAGAAARASAGQAARPGRPGLTDLLWQSRPVRLAWALSLAALVGLNLYLDRADRARARPPVGGTVTARSSAAPATDPAGAEPRTLLASRGEVLEALLGTELERRDEPPSNRRPRRTS